MIVAAGPVVGPFPVVHSKVVIETSSRRLVLSHDRPRITSVVTVGCPDAACLPISRVWAQCTIRDRVAAVFGFARVVAEYGAALDSLSRLLARPSSATSQNR